jgi:hypothetical protein
LIMLSVAASTVRSAEGPTRAETVAAELDLQAVGDGANAWIVHVLGVHMDGRQVWVQIAPSPEGNPSFLLRLSPLATARHALATLATVSLSTLRPSTIVSVMCTV